MRFKIFDCYFLAIDIDSNRISVISVKRNIERVLKPIVRSKNIYYSFYHNGVKKEYSLRDLIKRFFN